jgi:hypothetical protein
LLNVLIALVRRWRERTESNGGGREENPDGVRKVVGPVAARIGEVSS